MKKTKIIIFVCFAVLLSTLLVVQACTSVNTQATLEFWDVEIDEPQIDFDNYIAQFMILYPNIKINRVHVRKDDLYNKIYSASAEKNKPHILFVSGNLIEKLVSSELIVPVSDITSYWFIEKFNETALQAGMCYGKYYMIPDRFGYELMLLYNKKLVQNLPKTWEELEKIGNELVDKKVCDYPVVFNNTNSYWTIPFYDAFGGKVLKDEQAKMTRENYHNNRASLEYALNNDAMKKTMEFMYRLIERKIIPPKTDYDAANAMFLKEKAPFMINGAWSYKDVYTKGVPVGVCAIPQIEGKWPRPYCTVKGYVITRYPAMNSNQENAIKVFLSFMTEKNNQMQMCALHGQMPSLKSALADKPSMTNPVFAGRVDQLSKSIPMPVTCRMLGAFEAITNVQADVFQGKIKPAEAPALIQKKAGNSFTIM